MREGDRKGNGKRTTIDHWETVELLHSDTRSAGRDDLGISIEVQRPVFEGGREGRIAMGVVLRRGERMLRLFCRDGATTEISDIRDMLNELDTATLVGFTDRFVELRLEHDPPSRERDQKRGSTPKTGDAGSGLGQWSKPGKTARKRENKVKRTRSETV